jgi:hypothetical protein
MTVTIIYDEHVSPWILSSSSPYKYPSSHCFVLLSMCYHVKEVSYIAGLELTLLIAVDSGSLSLYLFVYIYTLYNVQLFI